MNRVIIAFLYYSFNCQAISYDDPFTVLILKFANSFFFLLFRLTRDLSPLLIYSVILLIFSIVLISMSLNSTVFFLIIYLFIFLLALGLSCSFSSFLRWKFMLLMYSSLLIYVFIAINFPPSTVFHCIPQILIIYFSFLCSLKYFLRILLLMCY